MESTDKSISQSCPHCGSSKALQLIEGHFLLKRVDEKDDGSMAVYADSGIPLKAVGCLECKGVHFFSAEDF